MQDQTDSQLLRAYAEGLSEPAFAELVRRYLAMVHSAAVRMVCDSHLAQDVTQNAFLALARNASQLADRQVLSGWLHRTAQNIAAQTVRTDVRRRAREQEAAKMNELPAGPADAPWEPIAQHLDAALEELDGPDRDVLLLRYFERKTAKEMGQRLGISDEAAQKRVTRAVERLRDQLARRGLTAGAAGLSVMVSANAVQAAPAGLGISISANVATALGAAVQTSGVALSAKTLAMTTLQKTIYGAALAAAIGTGIFEAQKASTSRSLAERLQTQQDSLTAQIAELARERDSATNRLTAQGNEGRLATEQTAELLGLRAEVSRLREDAKKADVAVPAADSDADTVKNLLDRVQRLKKQMATIPGVRIPEVGLLTVKDWVRIVGDNNLETDADYQKAFRDVRNTAQNDFASIVQPALNKYVTTNNGAYPTDLSQLQPFFSTPIDPAMLARWSVASSWAVPNIGVGHIIITQKNSADPRYDSIYAIGSGGYGSTGQGGYSPMQTLDPVLSSYFSANALLPTDPAQLLPFTTTPEQKSVLANVAKDYQTMSPSEKAAAQKEVQQEIQKLMSQSLQSAK